MRERNRLIRRQQLKSGIHGRAQRTIPCLRWRSTRINDTMDKTEGDFEGLSDHSHRLPLVVGVDDPLIQVKRVLMYRPWRYKSRVYWCGAPRSAMLTCSDLTLTNEPNMGTVIPLSLGNQSGEQSMCSRSDANCCKTP